MASCELAWAAGLFEGEGWISSHAKGELGTYAILGLTSTDEDVVRRFSSAIGVGSVTGPYRYPTRPAHWLPRWTWHCRRHADVGIALNLLWPWLCSRRRDKAREVAAAIEAAGFGSRRKPWTPAPWMEIAA